MLDLHLPVLGGLATTRRLRAEFPTVRVLILSKETSTLRIGQVLKTGALGYVRKNTDNCEIVAAIQAVGQGKRFLSSELGLLLLDKLLTKPVASPGPKRTDCVLSNRERDVLKLVANKLTSSGILAALFTSKRTIDKPRQNILTKTGAKNTATLVRYATGRDWLLAAAIR